MRYVNRMGIEEIFRRESQAAHRCREGLQRLGFHVFMGEHQSGTLSFIGGMDCQEAASRLEKQGICVRAGLHCAPLAHESAGTLESGTVRISFGHDADEAESRAFLRAAEKLR
jgi:selenocysteine lyase/cysteine desulfurase